jgi:kynurenine formamidase
VISTLAAALSDARKVDLTHPLGPRTPPWPGNTPFSRSQTADYEREGHFCAFDLAFAEHTGTHIDAPVHVVPGGSSLDALDLRTTVGPAAVFDIEAAVGGDRDFVVPLQALEFWEAQHGRLPRGAFVLVNTGWSRRFGDAAEYRGLDDDGVPHYPSLSPELAEALVERRARAVGVDTLSPDAGPAESPVVHKTLLGNGVLIIENLANLAVLPAAGAAVVALPMSVVGGTGSPTRVLALLDPA